MTTKKQLISLALFLPMLIASLTTPSAFANSESSLTDVNPNNPQYKAISDVISANAMSTNNFGQFRPQAPINRVSYLKAAFTYLGEIPPSTLNNFTPFVDVPEDIWYAPYVKKALEVRAIDDSSPYFNPGTEITRQEGLILAASIYGLPTPYTTVSAEEVFEDIRPSRLYSHLFKAAKQNGIIFYQDADFFKPAKTLTRADAAELLYKTKQAAASGGAIIPSGTVTPVEIPPVQTDSRELQRLLDQEKFPIFVDVWDKINREYYYQDDINQDQLIYHAIEGMVDSIEDPYSVYNSPNQSGNDIIYVPSDYEGIGAIIDNRDQGYFIQTTLNNSPANKAGLRPNDQILRIDGQTLNDLTPNQVTDLIKGKAGTTVRLTIKRSDEILEFELIRQRIDLENIHSQLYEDILYLRVDQISIETYSELQQHIEQKLPEDSKKIILDLRNNPGGYLDVTRNILNLFVPKGEITFHTQEVNNSTTFTSIGPAPYQDLEIIVLINQGSASAAEIIAAALQENNLAQVVGTNSYGKSTVQEITTYQDNSSLKLTVAKWLTPNKIDLKGTGVTPDHKVEITSDQARNGIDPQLDKALQLLN